MRDSIEDKIETGDPSLYVSIAFPILVAFILTYIGSRTVSYLMDYGYIPELYLRPSPGLHIHHFTYGIFALFAAGYLGLVTKQARAKFWIALLLGFGLGLAMDEFGMWLRLRDDDIVRWSYDGFNLIMALFFFILTIRPGLRFAKKLYPRETLKRMGFGGKNSND